jgi:starch phosphorylase
MPEQSSTAADAVQAFKDSILAKLKYVVGKDPGNAFDHDWFEAVALAARDHVIDRWEESTTLVDRQDEKRIYYLSLEFLIGRLLLENLYNLGLLEVARQALAELNVDLERIREVEPDAPLGNGGLGRLAACFMESMATLRLAAHGYGIRYEHGLFRQAIVDGWQAEQTETWLDGWISAIPGSSSGPRWPTASASAAASSAIWRTTAPAGRSGNPTRPFAPSPTTPR